MAWIDVSLPIGARLPVFPGDPPPYRWQYSEPRPGEPGSFGASLVVLGSHAGTHVDAPAHFVPGGSTVDRLPLEVLCGPAVVLDLRGRAAIDADALLSAGLGAGGAGLAERVLLRTAGRGDGEAGAPLTEDGARALLDAGARLVGVDRLSIERDRTGAYPVHHLLLGAEPPVVVVEGLELGRVEAGVYDLVVLPLRIEGGDGAPARAALRARPAGSSGPLSG